MVITNTLADRDLRGLVVLIGYQITYGLITSPAELGDTLRRDLGPLGPGSRGRLQQLEANYGRMRGSP